MHITLLLLLSQFFFWSAPIDWQMDQTNVSLWGTVIDENSGRAVDGAVVYAISGSDLRKTVADANGHFIFLTLLPGTYRLCASKAGYAGECTARGTDPEELFAGYEYGATVVLSSE